MSREDGLELEFSRVVISQDFYHNPWNSIKQQIQKNRLSVSIANLCNKPFARLGEAKPTSPTSRGWFANC